MMENIQNEEKASEQTLGILILSGVDEGVGVGSEDCGVAGDT